MQRNEYRPEIDGLRALAVLGVLGFHANIPFLGGGYAGVDVFFVISGYLITKIILKEYFETGSFSFSNFYIRRFWRLAPALIATIICVFLLSSFTFSPSNFKSIAGSSVAGILSFSNIYFWSEAGYFDIDSHLKPLLHTWSLSVEEQFYFFWPALIIAIRFYFRNYYAPLIAVATIGIISFLTNYKFDQDSVFYLTPFRVFEFSIGAAIPWMRNAPTSLIIRNIIAATGLCMILLSYVLYSAETLFPYAAALPPCFGAALFIWATPGTLLKKIFGGKFPAKIGVLSYSIYLAHWPIIVFFSYYFGTPTKIGDQIAVIFLSLFFAILLYCFIEKPFRSPKVKKYLLPSIILSTISMLGTHAYFTNGWIWRLDERGERNAKQVAESDSIDCIKTKTFENLLANCAFGNYLNNEKFDVILIGDSHARTFRPGLDKLFKDKNLSAVWVGKGASFPILNASIYENANKKEKDLVAYQKIYSKIIELHPKYVVIMARWDLAFNTYHQDGKRRFIKYNSFNQETLESSRNAFYASIFDTTQLLNKNGIKVIFISSIPYVGNAVPECYYSKSFCTTGLRSSQDVLTENKETNQLIKKISHFGNNGFFNLTEKICPQNSSTCSVEMLNTAIFKDPHHFTPEGSRLLANIYSKELINQFR